MEGKIFIARMNSNDPSLHNMIDIRIEDGHFNLIMDIHMKPEDLGLALAGAEPRPCTIIENIERGEELGENS